MEKRDLYIINIKISTYILINIKRFYKCDNVTRNVGFSFQDNIRTKRNAS